MSTTAGNDIESSNAPSNFESPELTDRHDAHPFTSGEYTSSGSEIPTPAHPLYYKMNHAKRGLALIFNHEYFANNYKASRKGTNVDCNALKTSLTRLGFIVSDYQNLTIKDITTELQKVAGIDHTDHDCLVVAVLTHGEPDILWAYDGRYSAEMIWSSFTEKNSPSLRNKPKIFFIQACRGDKLDAGTTLRERMVSDGPGEQPPSRIQPHADLDAGTTLREHTVSDGPGEQPPSRIQPHADFLIAYSHVPGYYSWRNEGEGSWFMQALCQKLNEYGTKHDLLTILTFVCQCVAIDFESKSELSNFNEKKQIPCITSMLKYLVLFTPPKKDVGAEL